MSIDGSASIGPRDGNNTWGSLKDDPQFAAYMLRILNNKALMNEIDAALCQEIQDHQAGKVFPEKTDRRLVLFNLLYEQMRHGQLPFGNANHDLAAAELRKRGDSEDAMEAFMHPTERENLRRIGMPINPLVTSNPHFKVNEVYREDALALAADKEKLKTRLREIGQWLFSNPERGTTENEQANYYAAVENGQYLKLQAYLLPYDGGLFSSTMHTKDTLDSVHLVRVAMYGDAMDQMETLLENALPKRGFAME